MRHEQRTTLSARTPTRALTNARARAAALLILLSLLASFVPDAHAQRRRGPTRRARAARAARVDVDALAARATRLADEYVAEYVKEFPESAELSGLPVERHDGLTDNSMTAVRRWLAHEDRWARELARMNLADLEGRPEWVTLGFLKEAVESSRAARVCQYWYWPVNHLSGWQAGFAQLADAQPVGTDERRRDALARWSKVARSLDNEVENLREGLRLGYSTPRPNVRLVITQLEEILALPVNEWPFYSPARRDSSDEFKRQWTELLTSSMKPAVERYRNYLRDEYAPRARTDIAIRANPNGARCYRAAFRAYTTIDRTGEETFRLGRARVERNRREALEIGRARLGTRDLKSLVERISTDPSNKFKSREEMLEFARAAVVRSGRSVAGFFRQTPRSQMVVEPYPDFLERTASDSYWPAAQDGSRPAMYRIALARFAETTRSNSEITAFHEGYPGHHLQISLAAERPSAHMITRLVGNSGFVEGWARYAEALAEEMGLYTSDYARANRRLWPSRGMVVDPGIHLFGWTREQAAKFMAESGRFGPEEAARSVDRIAVWPAQLTAYDTGALEFFALREEAETKLGPRFDLREFHEVVLGSGSITLPMLRQKVRSWISSKNK
ncbi:MAG TPA: DUF885 domain-containing protein [Pyrinomonadaceae bacterium]|nr:DUF885 domain-containing protein [Pyrinomonadaceae bacterium]